MTNRILQVLFGVLVLALVASCSEDLRPFDPSRTDISGFAFPGATKYRDRSWPVESADNFARPDTLGWLEDPAGNLVPSGLFIRDRETVW